MTLANLLETARGPVLAEAEAALEGARLRHYATSDPATNAARLAGLYDVLATCAGKRSVLPMVEHAERIARERFEGGFDLTEVQTAFNVLEEAVWRRITAELPADAYPEAFGLTSAILGSGKQALAVRYVALARQTHAPALDLGALFEGG